MRLLRFLGFSAIIVLLYATTAFSGNKVYYYYTDPAGTPIAMTDSNGTVVWKADYKPFGEEQSINPQTQENDMRFVGKEKDKETGLQYFGARYMKDEIGRFTSPDSVGPLDPRTGKVNQKALLNPQRLNPYAYALNNPYSYVDPDGKFAQFIVPLLVGIFVGELMQPQTMASPHRDSFIDQHGTDLMMMALPIENIAGRVSGLAGKSGQELYESLMSLGRAGRGVGVREVAGSAEDAQSLFKQLSEGGKTVQKSGYPGSGVERPDGTFVGFRDVSKSGPPTIDIGIPGQSGNMKIKFIEE